jgi:hypothetical protein
VGRHSRQVMFSNYAQRHRRVDRRAHPRRRADPRGHDVVEDKPPEEVDALVVELFGSQRSPTQEARPSRRSRSPGKERSLVLGATNRFGYIPACGTKIRGCQRST